MFLLGPPSLPGHDEPSGVGHGGPHGRQVPPWRLILAGFRRCSHRHELRMLFFRRVFPNTELRDWALSAIREEVEARVEGGGIFCPVNWPGLRRNEIRCRFGR